MLHERDHGNTWLLWLPMVMVQNIMTHIYVIKLTTLNQGDCFSSLNKNKWILIFLYLVFLSIGDKVQVFNICLH